MHPAPSAVAGGADLDALLNPTSIALIGATESSAWTQALLHNLRTLGYAGSVHLVNPRYEEVFGERCHRSVRRIGEAVDCAYLMTGTDAVPAVVDDLGAAGVRAAIVLTAGYRETGGEGQRREAELVGRCQDHGIALQGPNCLGNVNYHSRMAAYGLPLPGPLQAGRIGLLTQSGALLLHLHRLAHHRGIGLSYLISSGNEAMLDATDYVEHLLEDPDTAVIGLLLESIRRPERFLELAGRSVEMGKPLVVLRVGRSPAGARAAAAHTGALASEDRVVEAVFRQKGIVQVRTPEDLVEVAGLLAAGRAPEGRRTAVLTASGGASGLVADLAAGTRLELPDFSEPTKTALAGVLPSFATPQNPLDTTGLVVLDMSLLPQALDVIGRDRTFDAVLVVWDPPRDAGLNPERTDARLAAVAAAVHGCAIPAFVCSYVAGELTDFGREALRRHGVHFANGIEAAVRALDAAIGWSEARRHLVGRPPPTWPTLEAPALPSRQYLTEAESLQLLARYGISTPPLRIARDASQAGRLADECGYPVVLKVQSPDLPHKTEAGAVRLNVLSREECEASFDNVVAKAQLAVPGARLEGVLVARQLFPVAELIAGVSRDPQFGPIVLVGMGGVFAEVLDDIALRMPPIDFDEAVEMLARLRGHGLLEGVRGLPRADVHAAAATLVRLGRLAVELTDSIDAVDINPLLVLPDGEGAVAGDALVVLR